MEVVFTGVTAYAALFDISPAGVHRLAPEIRSSINFRNLSTNCFSSFVITTVLQHPYMNQNLETALRSIYNGICDVCISKKNLVLTMCDERSVRTKAE